MSALTDQTIALAGLLQACYLVDQIAREGRCDEVELETAINSLFVTSPDAVIEVYGNLSRLQRGLQLLHELLDKQTKRQRDDWLRYALSILHLQSRLRKNGDMLNAIAKGLEQAEMPRQHFGLLHDNTVASLADTYQKTISTFNLRIQVSGDPNHLQSERNAARIRTLLLSGIRAATLWRQVGGHRWHLLFKRSGIASMAKKLASGSSE